MKVISFTIPETGDTSIMVQEDILPYFYNHLHRHPEVQITWILKGEGTLVAGNYMQHFKSGEVYIIGANQPHLFRSDESYFEENSKKLVHAITIFFTDKKHLASLFDLPEMKGVRLFLEKANKGVKIPVSNMKETSSLLLEIKSFTGIDRLLSFVKMMVLFSKLKSLRYLSTEIVSPITSDADGMRMNDIYQYTMRHYMHHISLDTIASIANMTPQAFCRYFKTRTRKSYVTFLNEIRINEAFKLLSSRRYESIGSLAVKTGFSNVVSFNRVFKQVLGKPPREYVKEFQEKVGEDS
jgi:AraC-like DNA-binding protein